MAQLSKQQVTDIIKQAPAGTSPAGIVASLRQKGHTLEGFEEAAGQPAAPTAQEVRGSIGLGMGSLTAAEEASKEANRPLVAARVGESPLAAGGKAIANVPSSAFNLARNIATAVASPIETVKGLFNIGLGGVQKLIPGEQLAEQDFNAFTEMLGERYGSLERLQLTATNDPFGFGADIVGGVTAVGRGALRGATRQAATEAAQTAATRATSIVGAPITKPIRAIKDKAGKVAVSRMDKALQLNPTDKRRIALPNVANKSASEWLVERKIAGGRESIIEQLSDISTQSKATKDSTLAGISKAYRIVDEEIPTIDYATNKVRTGDTINAARQALETIKDAYKGVPGNDILVRQVDDLLGRKELTLSQLDNVKSLIDRNLQIFKTTGDIRSGATAVGLGNIRNAIKTFIETEAAKNGAPHIKALNKDTQVATEIRKAILKKESALSNNRTLSLTDLMVGIGIGGGVDLGTGAAAVVAKKVFESAKFQTNLARQLDKLSNTEMVALERALAIGAPSPEYIAIVQRVMEAALSDTEVDIPPTIQEDIPPGAVPIRAEDDAPEGHDVQRIGDTLYAIPRNAFDGLRNVPGT